MYYEPMASTEIAEVLGTTEGEVMRLGMSGIRRMRALATEVGPKPSR